MVRRRTYHHKGFHAHTIDVPHDSATYAARYRRRRTLPQRCNPYGTVAGWIACDALGGELPIEAVTFGLFPAGNGSAPAVMRNQLRFRDGAGHPLTLSVSPASAREVMLLRCTLDEGVPALT